MAEISQSLLHELAWIDFSILIDRDKNYILILICKDEKQKNGLYNMLSNYACELVLFMEDDETITINLEFEKADRALTYKTALTVVDYPPLGWLKNGLVKYMTAGTWISEGTMSDYYKPLIPVFARMSYN